jgi:hypothetical protein
MSKERKKFKEEKTAIKKAAKKAGRKAAKDAKVDRTDLAIKTTPFSTVIVDGAAFRPAFGARLNVNVRHLSLS